MLRTPIHHLSRHNRSKAVVPGLGVTISCLIRKGQSKNRVSPHIDIRGMINDAVEGLIGAAEPTVSEQVNGQSVASAAAQVADRYISGPRLLFEIGMPFQSSQYIDA